MVKARAERLPMFLKWLSVLSPIYAERSALLGAAHAGYSSFRLVRLLPYEQAKGSGGICSPRKIFKIRHSEIASEAMFGSKCY